MIDLSQYKKGQEPKSGKELDLSQFKKKKERSIKEHIQHTPEYIAEGGYGSIVGAPRTITSAMEFASKFPNQKRFISVALAKPEEFLKKIGFPTQEEATKQAQKRTGTSEFGEHPIQKGATAAGSILGSAALTPSASFGSAAKAGITGLASLGAGIGAGLEGGVAGEIGGAIGLPALVTAMAALKTGKFSPSTKELRQLYEEGKTLGLNDKELAPILQSRFKKKLLGKIARPSTRSETAIQESKNALGNLYESLKTSGKKIPRANQDQEERLFHSLNDITSKLRQSKMPSNDKEVAINKIEHLMNDVIENGIGVDEIIETWQDINQSVNWNSLKNGKKVLESVKSPLSDLFSQLSPEKFKKFRTINKMWANLTDTAAHIKKRESDSLLNLGKMGALGKGLIDLVWHQDPNMLYKTTLGIITLKGAQKLASEMLTNPRLNNLFVKTISGLASNSNKTKLFYLQKFIDNLDEFPEIQKEFDYSKLKDSK